MATLSTRTHLSITALCVASRGKNAIVWLVVIRQDYSVTPPKTEMHHDQKLVLSF